ncbi:MAG: hypothetical protein MZW92_02645 [Comamonadaceae bacterium]|nr:hypothetical protein [Comamonadaceae bacterium]
MGAGKIAHRFCQAMNGIKETLYAIASRDIGAGGPFRHELRLCEGLRDVRGTPRRSRGPMRLRGDPARPPLRTRQALPRGRQERPLREVVHAQPPSRRRNSSTSRRAKGLFVMEAMWTRFLPAIQEVKKLVDDGEIGEIIEIDADFCFESGAAADDRLFDPALGGGALLDVGIYPLTLVNLFLGVPGQFRHGGHDGADGRRRHREDHLFLSPRDRA